MEFPVLPDRPTTLPARYRITHGNRDAGKMRIIRPVCAIFNNHQITVTLGIPTSRDNLAIHGGLDRSASYNAKIQPVMSGMEILGQYAPNRPTAVAQM